MHAEFVDTDKTLAHGILVNMSDSGSRLITNVGVPRGRLAQLKLRPSTEDVLITGAQIVWTAEGVQLPMDLTGLRVFHPM